jgi:hypothetical protein
LLKEAAPPDHPRRQKLERFVASFSKSFERLLEPPFHPKWGETDLDEEVPGWQRIRPAPKAMAED